MLSSVLVLGVILVVTTLQSGDAAACSGTATYTVQLDAKWTKARHPVGYPAGSAHFSPLVVYTHMAGAGDNRVGGMASEGFEKVAETGATGTMITELKNSNKVKDQNTGSGIGTGGGDSSKVMVKANDMYSYVSGVSMIAPSPDHVVMFELNLCKNGQWITSMDVNSLPIDGGTDSGATFKAANQNTNPQEAIAEVACGGNFYCNNGTPKPAGTFLVRLVSVDDEGAPPPQEGINCGKFKRRRGCNKRRRRGCRWRKRKCINNNQ